MWELAKVREDSKDLVALYLEGGYEPFDVSTDTGSGYNTIWFRKEVKVNGRLRVVNVEEKKDEVHSEQGTDRGRSSGTIASPKGKTSSGHRNSKSGKPSAVGHCDCD